jgi:hypothetical protein
MSESGAESSLYHDADLRITDKLLVVHGRIIPMSAITSVRWLYADKPHYSAKNVVLLAVGVLFVFYGYLMAGSYSEAARQYSRSFWFGVTLVAVALVHSISRSRPMHSLELMLSGGKRETVWTSVDMTRVEAARKALEKSLSLATGSS